MNEMLWVAPTAIGDPTDAVFALPASMPLVLDLDGTLIAGDLLYKSFFSILRRNPLIVFGCAKWLLAGRAALKRQTPCATASTGIVSRCIRMSWRWRSAKRPPAGRSSSPPPPTRFSPGNWRRASASSMR